MTERDKSPLVSIGIPIYNGERYIIECLESVLNQEYENWECVIVDNCSTDNTNELCTKFITKDSRFKLYKNTSLLNLMQNWNAVYSHASPDAKYFKIVPADDIIFPTFISENVELMENHSEVGICSSYRIDGIEIRGRGLNYFDGPVFNGKEVFQKEIFSEIDVTGSINCHLYKTEFLKKIPDYPKIFNESNLHVDMEIAYDLLNISDFGFIFNALSYTRQHDKSVTDTVTRKFESQYSSKEIILHKYQNNNNELSSYYKDFRLIYASFYLKRKLMGDKDCIDWHNKYLQRKFTFSEYINGIIKKNRFTYALISSKNNK